MKCAKEISNSVWNMIVDVRPIEIGFNFFFNTILLEIIDCLRNYLKISHCTFYDIFTIRY